MRYIQIKAKPIPSEGGGGTFGTRNLIAFAVNNDKRFNATGPAIRMSVRLAQVLDESGESDVLALDDEIWRVLCEAVEDPSEGYPFRPARIILPMIEDVKNATAERPKEEPAPATESQAAE